uniref:Uncharacterized protein n=1 Tax=Cacopsylla melanoneura TaxID=428564 RepID=A0A8D9BA22_9HEMI
MLRNVRIQRLCSKMRDVRVLKPVLHKILYKKSIFFMKIYHYKGSMGNASILMILVYFHRLTYTHYFSNPSFQLKQFNKCNCIRVYSSLISIHQLTNMCCTNCTVDQNKAIFTRLLSVIHILDLSL